MTERRPLSVCMAAYNGARFIREQADSVLWQLGPDDELIVADDASQDETVRILEGLRDARVRVLRHQQNAGVKRAFENALQHATGEIIFLCDQDDVWREDKVERVLAVFANSPATTLVLTNAELIDGQGRPLGQMLHMGGHVPLGVAANLLKNRYQGSTMAFRREILEAALPFPEGIPMHDSWIGMVNALVGRAAYLPQCLIYYRRHESNATSRRHGPIHRMIAQRWGVLRALVCRSKALAHTRKALRSARRASHDLPAAVPGLPYPGGTCIKSTRPPRGPTNRSSFVGWDPKEGRPGTKTE
jgi:glycosyltransferase involved in cell wall biosynthesis